MRNKYLKIIILIALVCFPMYEFSRFVYYENYPYQDCGIIVKKFETLEGKGRTEHNFIVDFEKRGVRLVNPTVIDYQFIGKGDKVCYEYNPIREKSHNKHDLTLIGLLGFMFWVLVIIFCILLILGLR